MNNEAIVQSHAASLRNLENQIGQLVTAVSNKPQGSLPSNTENPRREGKEHCKVINLSLERRLIVQLVYQKEELSPTKVKKTLK